LDINKEISLFINEVVKGNSKIFVSLILNKANFDKKDIEAALNIHNENNVYEMMDISIIN